MSELGPVSQAILEYVNSKPGFISFWNMIITVSKEENVNHTSPWWFRRLIALALEGHIEATVYHLPDNNLSFKFRHLQEAKEPVPSITETTMAALNLLRHDDESDDQLINRLLEHARAHMIIKGATPI